MPGLTGSDTDGRCRRWEASPAPPSDTADLSRRVDELDHQLRQTQEANERLRSYLAAFGTHSPMIGNESKSSRP
jgi:hypothetical protein